MTPYRKKIKKDVSYLFSVMLLLIVTGWENFIFGTILLQQARV